LDRRGTNISWGNPKAPTPYRLHTPVEVRSPKLKPTTLKVLVEGKA
jgi:hypothetical protein